MMSKQSDAIIFTVEIPHEVEKKLLDETGHYSRYELAANSVKEFNERKHELDHFRGFANGEFHEHKETKILKLETGVIVSWKIEEDTVSDFTLKEEYIKLKEEYEDLVNSLRDTIQDAKLFLGGLG